MIRRTVLSLALALAAAPAFADSPTKLLRFPDIHGDRIAFVHAGDIYVVNAAGGTAQRLTSGEGAELYPKFSPDGSRIAFSAEYNGTRQVYVMPAAGGAPTQLTWYNDIGAQPPRGGTDYRVLDWTPDGRNVVVRANRNPSGNRDGRPYLVPADGGMETPMPIPESGGGMLSPDGTKFVYTPIDREFRTWKRYRGGRAQDVWVYDLAADTSLQLTADRATDQQPMWVGDTVYFVSDRNDTRLNLYAVAPTGGEARKLTAFTDFDVLWPSAGADAIVFEHGGSIWRFDPRAGQPVEVPIRVAGDFPQTLPRFVEAGKFVESFDLAPDGRRAVFGARGEVFTLPAEHGTPRNLSHTPDAREHSVAWSPDGRQIAYLSDASGEYELYVRAQDGSGEPRRITTDGDIWRFAPVWSPDSKKLAFADKKQRLRVVDIASGRIDEIDRSDREDITEYAWSPDSRWLAYTRTGPGRNTSIWVHELASGRSSALTDGTSADREPVFDPEGRWLYFLSDRDYNLAFSSYEFNWLYNDATRIYAAALSADGPALFVPRSDETAVGDAADDAEKKEDATPRVRIDIDGFAGRVQPLKAQAGNYADLDANADGVFFIESEGRGDGPGTLKFLATEGETAGNVAVAIGDYALSGDGKKVLVQQGEAFSILDASAAGGADALSKRVEDGKLAVDGWTLRIEPPREWRQMYVDAWRMLRDWFYDPGMHGNDWNAVRARYEPLVAHVHTRADLDYVLGEIAGETNAGHVYVQSGDEPEVERRPGGLLGAEIVADASGYFRVKRIFPADAGQVSARSPLSAPGVDVDDGDYILAVNGVDARSVENVYALLENTGGDVVTLRVNDRPGEAGAHDERVTTVESEQDLRYTDWVQTRRALVDRLSGGRIGYIHVPNTAVEGSRELFRGLVAYADKDALIIDDRYNGGGFIPDRLVELLAREPLNYWKQRGLAPNATPLLSHRGPKAMLINGLSSSGGDALPFYFRKLGLGPIIGTRTWGGLIGLSGNPSLADNGSMSVPTFSFINTEGRWDVENRGVAPDVEVIDRPELVAAGRDPSVEKAVEMLLQELEANPVRPFVAPPAPTVFPPAAD
ncbi:S41 family peptidase [Coralloluteibacterium stylophorae]|uniref:Tricorn protease homolog n=1 Tax=Coralloluteibacterium stylophorae TaxID=1776034 RepID=A0AAP2CC38_9GAMM|nr:S41 family peptidase [Coralloluteibacterium stylophorae]MBS7457509.1 PD40 domain-containing protein [Coralloluteibacterium stylophorae]